LQRLIKSKHQKPNINLNIPRSLLWLGFWL